MKNHNLEHNVFRYSWWASLIGSGLLLFAGTSVSFGFLLGGLIGALTFKMLIIDVNHLLRLPQANLNRRVWQGYLRRYLLYGAALVVALLNPQLSFGATIIGLLIPKLMIYVLFIARRK